MSYVQLASNESPFGPSPLAIEAMRAVLAGVNRYPDNDASELQVKLAARHQVTPEQVIVWAGLTDFLGVIARTLMSEGLNAVTSDRSFIVYPIATQAAGGTLIQVPMRGDGFHLDAIASVINSNTRIIFLANPNNPTGALVTADEVDRFLQNVPEHVLVVLDEAYFDFAQDFARLRNVNYSHSLDYVRQGRNVVVLRTFSKAHGLAGVRVGYGIGSAELLARFAELRSTYSISSVAQAGALAAIIDEAHTRKVVENNTREADRMVRSISELGFAVANTWANFIYINVGEDAVMLAKRLRAENIIIRPLAKWGAPTAVRVTVGTPEEK
ncbi:MAG TPA: histidinol-phosphate transaminase [Candidatus Acidoferrales bacterium]|nr:histidinol-phosphate transaminase [Candidatus Acidoferrales bacterium]